MWGLFSFFKHIYNPARKALVNSCAEIALGVLTDAWIRSILLSNMRGSFKITYSARGVGGGDETRALQLPWMAGVSALFVGSSPIE